MVFAICLLLFSNQAESKIVDWNLEQLAWLGGSWVAEDGKTEEHWTMPASGLMLGMNRDISRDKPFFEFLRIEQRKGGIFYLASPRGREPVAFKLVSLDGKSAVFENPSHDFPQRLHYAVGEDGKLCVVISAISPDNPKKIRWCWQRGSLAEP